MTRISHIFFHIQNPDGKQAVSYGTKHTYLLPMAAKVDSGRDSEENRATEEPTQVVVEVVPEAGIEPATKGL